MFGIETNDKSRKMSAVKIREKLIVLYPIKFNFPSELAIKQFIAYKSQNSKYATKRNHNKWNNIKQKEEKHPKLYKIATINSKPSNIYKKFIK